MKLVPQAVSAAVASAVALVLAGASAAPPQDAEAEVVAGYRKLADAQDEAGLAKLWAAHPELVLTTIDEDLEGSLALREKSETPDETRIAQMHARAIFG
ncbi:MAG TPA: hypothetical protein VFF36_13595, partial [Planctomycetota bacterium]|nr:hypothetical protein [Planctomycetota bacterium]